MHAARQDCDAAAVVCIMTSQHNFLPQPVSSQTLIHTDQTRVPLYTCTSHRPHNNHMITEPKATDKRNQCLDEEGDWQDGMALSSQYVWRMNSGLAAIHDRVLCLHAVRYLCRPSALILLFFVHVQRRTSCVCAHGCLCPHSPRTHMDIDGHLYTYTHALAHTELSSRLLPFSHLHIPAHHINFHPINRAPHHNLPPPLNHPLSY